MRLHRTSARLWAARSRWDEAGATAIEYALMIIMVAFVIFVSTAVMGGKVADWFETAAIQL